MNRSYAIIITLLGTLLGLSARTAHAKEHAAQLFCEAFAGTPSCSGRVIACSYCHVMVPPERNSFGQAVEGVYKGLGRPFPTTAQEMRDAILPLLNADQDQDGFSTTQELAAGTMPGSRTSRPTPNLCKSADLDREAIRQTVYQVCEYDYDYAYKKVWMTACGELPDFDEFQRFARLSTAEKKDAVDRKLDECLETRHWRGKDGVVWEIGHYKIRPVGSVKRGEDEGPAKIVDYYDDYHLFVYTQIDDHDARDVLLADYTVTRSEPDGGDDIAYTKKDPKRLDDKQVMQPDRRVGLVTSFWNLAFYLNYTGIARVLVAQAFYAFLGIDLSQMQGLSPPDPRDSKFKDYDGKGVERGECRVCHTTVDPLAYPFRNYNGLTGTKDVTKGIDSPGLKNIDNLGDEDNLTPLSYSLSRMDYLNNRYPGIKEMPEEGYILGQKVANLKEWAQVLVNSDLFAANTVRDYWKVLVGHAPRSEEEGEFETVWVNFKTKHNFRVKPMLHDIVQTEAFGVP